MINFHKHLYKLLLAMGLGLGGGSCAQGRLVDAATATEDNKGTYLDGTTVAIAATPTNDISSNKAGKLDKKAKICIIGAGPAGLTAAWELKKAGYYDVTVLEKEDRVGGRCYTTERGSDMGAVVMGLPSSFSKLFEELGVASFEAPPIDYYDSKGDKLPGTSTTEMAHAATEGIRYVKDYYAKWNGVQVAEPTEIPKELHQSWEDFVKNNHYENLEKQFSPYTTAFGYDPKLPAFYNVLYLPPSILFSNVPGLTHRRVRAWHGGTAQAWRRLVQREDINVYKKINITKIVRSAMEVKVTWDGEERIFDKLIIACNPRPLVDGNILDATASEKALYGQIKTLDYRTYEVKIEDIYKGKRGFVIFRDTLENNTKDRPVMLAKRFLDSPVSVVYVNASGKKNDEEIRTNIKKDIAKIGGNVIITEAFETKHWPYFPHIGTETIAAGFHKKVAEQQGSQNTFLVGAVCTFDIVACAMDHAKAVTQRLINGEAAAL